MTAFPRLFRQFIGRALYQEWLRALLAIAGIALGVVVVTAIRLANTSVLDSFRAAVDAVGGGASLRVAGPSGPVDERRVGDLQWLEQYGSISPVSEHYAMVVRDGAAPLLDGGPLVRGELLYVMGVDVLRDLPVRKYRLLKLAGGHDPTPRELLDLLLDDHAVILTERFAKRLGYRIGDTITLAFGSRQVSLTVQGLLLDEGPARTLRGNFALMDIAALQWAADRLGFIDYVDIKLNDESRVEPIEKEIASRLPPGLTVEHPGDQTGRTETMIAAFQFNLSALGSVALLIGLFLIYNTVSVSVSSRREEIGILSAAGASRSLIVSLFLGEAGLLAAVGVALGLPIGQFLSRAAVQATAQTVETFYIATVAENSASQATLRPLDIVLIAAASLGLALLAAVIPAWNAARVEPIGVIRGTDRSGSTGWRAHGARLLAIPVFISGFVCTLAPPLAGRPVLGFVAELLFMLGFALLTPSIIAGFCRLSTRVIPRLLPRWHQEWKLAAANLWAGIPQTSVSIAALAMSLGMMIAIGVMVGSFRQTVVYWLDSVLTADLAVKPIMNNSSLSSATIDPRIVTALRQDPDVAAVAWYSSRTIPYAQAKVRLDTTDLKSFLDHARIMFKEPRDAKEQIRQVLRDRTPFVLVSESFSLKYHVHPGDAVSVDTPQGRKTFTAVAVYYDYSSNLGTILLDLQEYREHFGDDLPARAPFAMSLYLKPGVDAEKTRDRLVETVGAGQSLYFVTNHQVRREAMRIFESTFTITYALQSIAMIIAGAGVVATLTRLIVERQQEIALLSLIGATPRQVRWMVLIEATLIGVVSQAIGLTIGFVLAWVLMYVINVQSFGWTIQFHLPWAFVLQSSVAVIVSSALFGLYPAQRAVGLDALQTLREL